MAQAVDMATANKLLAAGYMTQKQFDINQKLNVVPPVDMLSAFANPGLSAPGLSAKSLPAEEAISGPVIGQNFDPPGQYTFPGSVITPNLVQELPPEVAPPPDVPAAPMVAPPAAPMAPMSGFELQAASIAQAGRAAQQQAEADQSAISQIERQQAKIQKDRQEVEDAALNRANDVQTRHTAVLDELAATKISPDNYWAEKSTGQKIGIGIAMILGAYGAANTGQNSAVEVINKAIDRDLDTQKANYTAKKGVAAELDSAYAKFYGVYKDEKAATAAAKAALIDQASLKIQGNAARYKGEAAVAAATGALGQLQSLKEAELAKVAQAKAWGEDPKYAGMDEKTRSSYFPESSVAGLPRGTASFGSAAAHDKFRETLGKMAGTITSLDQLKDMVSLNTGGKFTPEQKKRAEATIQPLVGALREPFTGPGILSIPEREMLEGLIANPTNVFSFDKVSLAALETIKNKLISDANLQGELFGLKTSTGDAASIKFKEMKK